MKNSFSKGVNLAFLTALISGFAVFINKFGVSFWKDPYAYTTAKNIATAVLVTGLIMLLKKLPELKRLSQGLWIKLILISLIGGSIPFLLFFKSLTMISAPEAAFIHKTLFLWVALFSYPFLKEKLSSIQFAALGILFLGIFMFDSPANWKLGMGSILALLATLLWAAENIIAKKILKEVSPSIVGWARMFLGSLFLILFLSFTGKISDLIPSSMEQTGWAILTGILLFGYVTTWYAALKYAPATIVSSVLVLAAPITAILNSIFITHVFPGKTLIQAAVMIIGILFISKTIENAYSKLTRRTSPVSI